MRLRRSWGLAIRPAQDALDLGHGNAPLAAQSGEAGNLAQCYPAAHSAGVDPEKGGYLTCTEEVRITHVTMLQDIADIK